jgi:hypothetical protein
MGAGALEAPTSKLRRYPVFDIRTLKPTEQKELIRLGRATWNSERPIDWSATGTTPGSCLRALDEWLLKRADTTITGDELYADLAATCHARILVARDKLTTKKKHKTKSIATVSKGIAEHLAPLINARLFPENFHTRLGASLPIHIPRKSLRRITIDPLLGQAEITFTGEGGKVLFHGTFHLAVAEAIVRSVLLGRESFEVPESRKEANAAVAAFFDWFEDIQKRLNQAVNESALGTGYEDLLTTQIYQRLGVNSHAADKILPRQINVSFTS